MHTTFSLQVCSSWRDKITKNTKLWKHLCWQKGGNVENYINVQPDFFFKMHQGLRSIVRLMETGDAFCKTPSTVCPRNLTETLKKFDCSLIAYGSGVLVIGQYILWENISCFGLYQMYFPYFVIRLKNLSFENNILQYLQKSSFQVRSLCSII